MKPTIVHVITELGTGGAERVLARLVTGPTPFRHVIVALTGDGDLATTLRAGGIEVVSLHMRRTVPSPVALVRLARIIRRERPVVVQTWLYHADLIGLLAAQLARFHPVIWNVRCSNMDLSLYRWSTRTVVRLLTWLSPLPAAVIVNSEAGHRWHNQLGYRPARWEVVPNGIDTDAFHPDAAARAQWRRRLGVGDETVLIGCVARRDPMKNHEGFLSAAAEAARRRPDLAFVLAGRGVTRADAVLAHLADRVTAPVHMIGQCDDPAGLTAALDIAILPSAFGEGFPSVVAEAMAAGVPCVVTDVGDAARIVADTGRIVPPRDPLALGVAIAALAADALLCAKLSEAARRRIRDEYGLAAATARYDAIWHDVAASTGKLSQRQGDPGTAPPQPRASQPPSDISVVIPVYNRERDIRRAIASVLRQTLPPREVIVVDDGSTDSTDAAVRAIGDPRLRLIRHERNLGAAAARNTGVTAAAGTWIAFLDSDDEWAPDKLARQLQRIVNAPIRAVGAITGYTIYDWRYGSKHVFRPGAQACTRESLAWGCRISPGSTLLIRRQAFLDIGPFDTRLTRFEDWDWLMRFSDVHTLVAEPDPLVVVHKSANPSLRRVDPALAVISDKHRAAFYKSSWLNGRCFDSTLQVERAACAYYDRRYALAVANLLRSVTIYPFRDGAFFRMVLSRTFGLLTGRTPAPAANPVSAVDSGEPMSHRSPIADGPDIDGAGAPRANNISL